MKVFRAKPDREKSLNFEAQQINRSCKESFKISLFKKFKWRCLENDKVSSRVHKQNLRLAEIEFFFLGSFDFSFQFCFVERERQRVIFLFFVWETMSGNFQKSIDDS